MSKLGQRTFRALSGLGKLGLLWNPARSRFFYPTNISEWSCVRFSFVFRGTEEKLDPEGHRSPRSKPSCDLCGRSAVESVRVSTVAPNPGVSRPNQAQAKASCVLGWGDWRKLEKTAGEKEFTPEDPQKENPVNIGFSLEPVVGIGQFHSMNLVKIADFPRKSTSLTKSLPPSITLVS